MIKKDKEGVTKFLEAQKAFGGIQPSQLPEGATAFVETERFIYRFIKVGGKLVVDSAAPCVQKSAERFILSIDSHYIPLKHDINDWIGLDMRMVLRFTHGINVMVEEVRGASIIGPNDSYDYILWEEEVKRRRIEAEQKKQEAEEERRARHRR